MTPFAFLRLTAILIAAVLPPASAAEAEWRTWTSSTGTTMDARLVKQAGGSVTLERRGGGNLSVKLSQLSADDRTYLMDLPEEPREIGETKIAGIDAEPGKCSGEIQCLADERWSYHLYLPQGFHTGRKWTEELKKSEPWEAAYWAGFLAGFDGDNLVKGNAAKLASELAGQADVQRAEKAEKAIRRFTTKHFSKYISMSDGKKADPAREAEAEKIAADYEGLPHAELIRKLGKPS